MYQCIIETSLSLILWFFLFILLLIRQCDDRYAVKPLSEAGRGTRVNTQMREITWCIQGSAGSFIENLRKVLVWFLR